ncbi:MAG: hypothetical protein R3C68_07085 [Myxococcota bacterium]
MVDERACVLESLLAFKRAGCDMILLTYGALDAVGWLRMKHRASGLSKVKV